MQYYFHIRHNGDVATDDDPEGTEFADVQAVRSEAIASIRQILAETLRSGTDAREGEMIIKDQSGETVFTVPFSMQVRFG